MRRGITGVDHLFRGRGFIMSFPTGYVLAEAQEAIVLSAIAYQCENLDDDSIKAGIVSALGSSTVLGGHYTLISLGISPDGGNLLYVAQDDRAPSRYAIVARGTDWNFLVDWVDDFDVLNTQDWSYASPPDPSILVARGSWDGLVALLLMTSSLFTDPWQSGTLTLVELLGQISASATSGLDLFVAGHSMGGALATILGVYLADTVGDWDAGAAPISLKTYTFASPTTGNQAFADYYNGLSCRSNSSWQAFRVYNVRDVVPFAYADIEGIADGGIPLSLVLSLTVAAMAAVVQTVLDDSDVSYVQVGNAVPVSGSPPGAPSPTCADPATTLDDFACWVGYEHSSLTYAGLLGASTDGLQDCSIDMSATTSASQGRLEMRAAAVRAQ
jgi:hypothetical protein